MERITGIEPASPAWKAGILPLNYIRIKWGGPRDGPPAGREKKGYWQNRHAAHSHQQQAMNLLFWRNTSVLSIHHADKYGGRDIAPCAVRSLTLELGDSNPAAHAPALGAKVLRRKVLGNYRKLAAPHSESFAANTIVVRSFSCFAERGRVDRKPILRLVQGHGIMPAGIGSHSLRRVL